MNKTAARWCYGITFAACIAMVLFGRLGQITGNELGFTLLCLFILLPVLAAVTGIVLGIQNGRCKWLYPVFAGFCSLLTQAAVFVNPLRAYLEWNTLVLILPSLVPAALGVLAGIAIAAKRRKQSRA
ncbi:MAG: hypothetical protein LBN26_00150 [Christensenellaceae bacterium]|jgi:hypothetical protein|nr:hypothetical protein [Christensenellaceae bacterium]